MKVIKPYLILQLSFGFFLLMGNGILAQTRLTQFNRDISKKITLIDFNNRVDRAVAILQNKKLSAISDTDHINIMMCFNTVFMTPKHDQGKLLDSMTKGEAKIKEYEIVLRFKGGKYDEFNNLLTKIDYSRNITKVYPNFQYNRGMGYYFPKLNMEYGGTPSSYAYFEVKE